MGFGIIHLVYGSIPIGWAILKITRTGGGRYNFSAPMVSAAIERKLLWPIQADFILYLEGT
jgi:hypothetical protein